MTTKRTSSSFGAKLIRCNSFKPETKKIFYKYRILALFDLSIEFSLRVNEEFLLVEL